MLNFYRARPIISWTLPLICLIVSSAAHAQSTTDFEDLFDGLDDAITHSDDSTVYNSLDSSLNPRIAEICGYIENGKKQLLEEVLSDKQHNFLKKQHGNYHSFETFFSKFKCHQNAYGGLSRGVGFNNQYTPLELSILHSKNSGIHIVSIMLEKLEAMPAPVRHSIFISNDFHSETIVSFAEGLLDNYINELAAVGISANGYDPTYNQIRNIKDRLKTIEQQTKQELAEAED